jgi:hypothetical protein
VKKFFMAMIMVSFIFTSVPAFCMTTSDKRIFCDEFQNLVEVMISNRVKGTEKYVLQQILETKLANPEMRLVAIVALDLVYEAKISELVYIPNQSHKTCMQNL